MDDLTQRLRDQEDQYVERKPPKAGNSDFKRTIVAFANSVPVNRTGLLFIGVGDDGRLLGVDRPDETQRAVRRIAESECYPPIYVDTEVLTLDGVSIVAVRVGPSRERPHFAGHAYQRRGSESVKASDKAITEMIQRRDDLRNFLLDWVGKFCSLTTIGKQPGSPIPMGDQHASNGEYVLEEVTMHFARFRSPSDGRNVTEPLRWLTLAWDDRKGRPWVVARLP